MYWVIHGDTDCRRARWTRLDTGGYKVFVGAISRYIRKSYKPRGFMEIYPVMWIVEV